MLNIRYKIKQYIRIKFYSDIIKYTIDNTSMGVDDTVHNRMIDRRRIDHMKEWVVLYTFNENYK